MVVEPRAFQSATFAHDLRLFVKGLRRVRNALPERLRAPSTSTGFTRCCRATWAGPGWRKTFVSHANGFPAVGPVSHSFRRAKTYNTMLCPTRLPLSAEGRCSSGAL